MGGHQNPLIACAQLSGRSRGMGKFPRDHAANEHGGQRVHPAESVSWVLSFWNLGESDGCAEAGELFRVVGNGSQRHQQPAQL